MLLGYSKSQEAQVDTFVFHVCLTTCRGLDILPSIAVMLSVLALRLLPFFAAIFLLTKAKLNTFPL
jgi:hypothetical protein